MAPEITLTRRKAKWRDWGVWDVYYANPAFKDRVATLRKDSAPNLYGTPYTVWRWHVPSRHQFGDCLTIKGCYAEIRRVLEYIPPEDD